MSRTDRHRPYQVQLADPLERNKYYVSWCNEFVFIHHTCSCRWHSMHYQRIEENRQRRHHDQRRARAALHGDYEVWDRR